MRLPRKTASLVVMLLAGLVAGCGAILAKEDPRTLALRNRYLLGEEPADARTIAEALDATGAAAEVVVVGQIRGGDFDPWAAGQASFILSEALPDTSGHGNKPGHDASTCPFCKRRAEQADATALVQFRGEQGQPLPIDARKLLGIKENQVVVVRGRGQVNDLGVLVVDADGIFPR